jgi:hypothetical protein
MNPFSTEHLPTASGPTPRKNFKVTQSPAFEKDLKKLSKRFPSLPNDLAVFEKTQLALFHCHGIDNEGIVRINNVGQDLPPLFKARKFACRSLKGKGVKSGIRIVYAYIPSTNHIHYIEIYYKGDQEIETKARFYCADMAALTQNMVSAERK